MKKYLLTTMLGQIMHDNPFTEDFFNSLGIKPTCDSMTMKEFLDTLTDDFIEDCGMDKKQILNHFVVFMQKMNELRQKSSYKIEEITIIGGYDKSGNHEDVSFVMKPGEVISIVGPTGSGKSRLLADIECLAQKDTPTGRQILINKEAPSQEKRFSIEHKLVAQLSQNMNFIMDLTVEEFITMHAESRMAPNIQTAVTTIAQCANELAGEKFTLNTPVTALSGGQSRALMIADTALLSTSPIVLIDEIENAGVDRKKALELLVKKEKIVLMSTHDPILALMGDKRIVIKNGGISRIVFTSEAERKNLEILQKLDIRMVELRNMLRRGEKIEFDTKKYFFI